MPLRSTTSINDYRSFPSPDVSSYLSIKRKKRTTTFPQFHQFFTRVLCQPTIRNTLSLFPSLFPNVRYFRGRGKQSVFPYRSSAGNVRSPILTRSRSRIRRGGGRAANRRCPRVLWSGRMREKEEKFHSTLDDKTVESSRPSPSSVPRCGSIIITTERNRTTLSIFPRFNYATKPENRNKTLSFKWIPAGDPAWKISRNTLSLSLYDDGKLEKLLLRYMYGFGDRIVRGE